MRILRITVSNIASLAGTHTVDFTREPLRSAGLFSISGATGAGKSSLLDALCLALYDATPRLQQVGRLAELADGGRQNDPRMLLRRGAGSGFSEVAFLGVDDQPWTARWSVRRGHNKPDGTLQSVEMTLYRGDIAPGATDAPVAEGGRKTDVQRAIAEKIGLTFEQFTRAVLLAQNDFAAFLKADDRQRAEILQALTGTERFEAISKAVYARSANEKLAVDALQTKLEGNAPFSAEARAEAETAWQAATRDVSQAETKLRELNSHAVWFLTRTKLTDDESKATVALTNARKKRDASTSRRTELELTETVSREARPLRHTALQAAETVEKASQTRNKSLARSEHQAAELTKCADTHDDKVKELAAVQAAQAEIQPLLIQARLLDAGFEPLQTRCTRATDSLTAAKQSETSASDKLQAISAQRALLIAEQQTLERQRVELVTYVPFASEASKWLDRIDTAIAAGTLAADTRTARQTLILKQQKEHDQLENERQTKPRLQLEFDRATTALHAAATTENAFDAEQLAADREHNETAHRVLSRLSVQLGKLHSQQERVQALIADVVQWSTEQTTDTESLTEFRDVRFPAASRDVEVAQSQFEFIQSAVDDHAQRLRESLQPGRECPVCGSLDHPYTDHAPDFEATAVTAAKKSVKDLEKVRDQIRTKVAQLETTIQNRSRQITERQTEREETQQAIDRSVWESPEHPAVATVVALSVDARMPAVDERMRAVSHAVNGIAASQKEHRAAAKTTEACRKSLEEAREKLAELTRRISTLETQHGIAVEKTLQAETAFVQAERRNMTAIDQLSELWSGLPSAQTQFVTDSAGFRLAFETATTKCSGIGTRLAELTSDIQKTDATSGPMVETLDTALKALTRCEEEHRSAVEDRDRHLEQRAELFEGRAVDEVEAGFAVKLKSAVQASEQSLRLKNGAEILLATAKADLESDTRTCSKAESERTETAAALNTWIEQFAAAASRMLTLPELDAILARDTVWISAERADLELLEHDVQSAEGACEVHAGQLREHLRLCPTQDDEPTVTAAASLQVEEQRVAKEASDAARAVILSDDERRRSNLTLAEQLEKQRSAADPWFKLNDLIGSKEGDKFRMIAQRRTLDVLLGYANRQLAQLSARYRLERLPESLNLIVIDRDMGDERRSVHSLSGGESFLVSLALALGLASLTSNRMRIESLFIDEGFGSLDPETLNIAMGALMHLEAQGRKVGVISHVTEMTDAIPVQIKVVKGRSGTSRIVVPGAEAMPTETLAESTTPLESAGAAAMSAAVVAAMILSILSREQSAGAVKVSARLLRKEIGCSSADFDAARKELGDRLIPDGRSLRLPQSD